MRENRRENAAFALSDPSSAIRHQPFPSQFLSGQTLRILPTVFRDRSQTPDRSCGYHGLQTAGTGSRARQKFADRDRPFRIVNTNFSSARSEAPAEPGVDAARREPRPLGVVDSTPFQNFPDPTPTGQVMLTSMKARHPDHAAFRSYEGSERLSHRLSETCDLLSVLIPGQSSERHSFIHVSLPSASAVVGFFLPI